MKHAMGIILLLLMTTGCGGLLPSSRVEVESPWHSYEEAKTSFDKIVLGKTTAEELRALGFDPFSTPNVKILTYLEVMNRFMPNPSIRKEDLPEGIQQCISQKSDCKALAADPRIIKSKRYGSVLLDMLNFRRETEETGWKFEAIIILVDDIVVYKLAGGSPKISEQKITRNPLGPLQNPGSIITGAATNGAL